MMYIRNRPVKNKRPLYTGRPIPVVSTGSDMKSTASVPVNAGGSSLGDASIKRPLGNNIQQEKQRVKPNNRRGYVDLSNPERAVIGLTQHTDASTFLHELWHISLDDLLRFGIREGASEQVRADRQTAIGASPGNPPVVVDETADLAKAAVDIIKGSSFDNNLQCIAEKEIIAVNCIADELKEHMLKNGAFEVKDPAKIEELLKLTLVKGKPNRDFVGRNAQVILEKIGYKVGANIRIILVETDEMHPFAQEEMLMPILPLIRAADFNEALAMAKRLEHGFRHSACIHSKNVDNMSRMAREMQTTMFVKNSASLASIGVGGDCPTAFTIATATGQGPTTPASFCRVRRYVLHGSFRII